MTLSQLALICAGFSLNAATFVLGVMVGCSLKRKDSKDDRDYRTEAQEFWHSHANRLSDKGPDCGARCRAKPKPEAGFAQRAAGQRIDHGE
jgi:hypothetical protein